MMSEEGMISIADDLAGEELRTRVTSSAVTGATCPAHGHHEGKSHTARYRRKQYTQFVTE